MILLTDLTEILNNNQSWAENKSSEDPDFFTDLAAGQEPDIFWVSCADSRVPPNIVTGLEPGELFVHRNIANLILPSDTNLLSCLQYSVKGLNVDHIIICGHYGCGGVGACLSNTHLDYVDNWIQEIRRIQRGNAKELEGITDKKKRVNRLSELNVKAQVDNVAETCIVQNAWENDQSLTVHGWMFELSTGKIHDLEVERSS